LALARFSLGITAQLTSGAVLTTSGDGGCGAVEYMYWNSLSISCRGTPPPSSHSWRHQTHTHSCYNCRHHPSNILK